MAVLGKFLLFPTKVKSGRRLSAKFMNCAKET
jgi:hypothetical protein